MQSQDLQVLEALAGWLAEGLRAHLCTIVETYGSSPRPVGSLLALAEDGRLCGSLSGGCVEEDLIEALRRGELAGEAPEQLAYGLSASDTERLGLPCGGTLGVIVEPIPPSDAQRTAFRRIVTALDERRCVERSVDLVAGALPSVRDVDAYEPLRCEASGEAGTQRLTQVFGPRRQLFVIGAGMVSRYLAEMALALDYDVTVCDPRQDMLDAWHVPGVRTLCAMPDDGIRERGSDRRTAIVALTHDPRIDDMGLLEAFETDAFYVGAMGSVRTSENRRTRLRSLDVPEDALARLHAPIGLPIGSRTPAEIAVSILAELTQVVREAERAEVSAAVGAAGRAGA